MSSTQPSPEKTQGLFETLPKDTKILCVCSHGNSRSKAIARALMRMGFSNAQTLGINDYQVPRQEKIKLITEHQLVVCATSTEASQVRRLLARTPHSVDVVTIALNEVLHARLCATLKGMKDFSEDDYAEIITQLRQVR